MENCEEGGQENIFKIDLELGTAFYILINTFTYQATYRTVDFLTTVTFF